MKKFESGKNYSTVCNDSTLTFKCIDRRPSNYVGTEKCKFVLVSVENLTFDLVKNPVVYEMLQECFVRLADYVYVQANDTNDFEELAGGYLQLASCNEVTGPFSAEV